MGTLILAGLSWKPAISGILVVLTGATILFGSVYLIVATNTGARQGMLIALGALFGFLSILTSFWWIQPPGNGPKGQDPSWRPLEIFVNEPGNVAKTEVLHNLPDPANIPTAAQIVAEHPELEPQLIASPENTTLSDIAGIVATNPDGTQVNGANILKQYFSIDTSNAETVTSPTDALNGWKVVSTSNAAEAAAAVDADLVAQGTFPDATGYKKLNAFEWYPIETQADACPDAVVNNEEAHTLIPRDPVCRVWYRIRHTFQLWHPARYIAVQIQPVVAQEAVPGQPPPTPKVDPSQPVITVVMVRDEGNVRAKPAYFFAICFSLFLVFVVLLHYRDKTLQRHLDEAEALRTGKAVVRAGKE